MASSRRMWTRPSMASSCFISTVACGLLATQPAVAQQFNIDIGTLPPAPGGGPPAATFGAAAGQPGTWNNITGTGTGPFPLVGLTGAATGVTLTRSSAVAGNFFSNNAGTSGDFELLMDDGQSINSRPGQMATYTITGLAAGRYGVYTYAWAPDFPGPSLTDVTCPAGAGVQRVGGLLDAANAFTLGVTHSFHIVNVAAGAPLTIGVALGLANGTLNGFQITRQESYNVDIGTGFGTPGAGFGGAANQPGPWTVISGPGLGSFPLTEAHGAVSSASVSRNVGGFDFSANNANTSGDFEALLDDLQDASTTGTPKVYTVSGLPAGPYRVTTYAIAPDSAAFLTNVTVPGSGGPNPQTIGGPMPANNFIQGVTHASHAITLAATASSLQISVNLTPGSGAGSINGFQVRRVRPCAGDISPAGGNGAVDVDDLVQGVINHWGPCPGACPPYCVGDVNHNCQVDIDDLLAVINGWGFCQ